MHYEIQDQKGNVIDIATDWQEFIQKYKAAHFATKEPLHLEKVEDEDESDM